MNPFQNVYGILKKCSNVTETWMEIVSIHIYCKHPYIRVNIDSDDTFNTILCSWSIHYYKYRWNTSELLWKSWRNISTWLHWQWCNTAFKFHVLSAVKGLVTGIQRDEIHLKKVLWNHLEANLYWVMRRGIFNEPYSMKQRGSWSRSPLCIKK